MEKTTTLIIILTIILVASTSTLIYILIKDTNNSEILNYYTYSKAICNESNQCRDYEVVCKGDELISLSPITEEVQFSPDWKDPRDEETINDFCNFNASR